MFKNYINEKEMIKNLQSLIQILKFNGVKGILFGRFDDSCKIDINSFYYHNL